VNGISTIVRNARYGDREIGEVDLPYLTDHERADDHQRWPAASLGTSDTSGVSSSAGATARRRRQAVDEQHPAEPGNVTLRRGQPGLPGQTDGGTHHVEEVGQHEGEHEQQCGGDAGLGERPEGHVPDQVQIRGLHQRVPDRAGP
jgi:hypothetical protein